MVHANCLSLRFPCKFSKVALGRSRSATAVPLRGETVMKKVTETLRGLLTTLLMVVALIATGTVFGPASNAHADFGGDAHNIFAPVTYDNATYDAALPQLESLVNQAGLDTRNLNGIMRGMYFFISPSAQGGTNPNKLKLARVIENQIVAKFADKTKYAGVLTDAIWINPTTTSVLGYKMLAVDSSTFYAEVDSLRLLSVPEGSSNYLVADEDLGLGRCAWSTSSGCVQTVPGTFQTMSALASTQPSSVQVGQTLTPVPTFTVTPWRVMYKWQTDTNTASTIVQLSTNPSYTVKSADAGALLSCFVYLSKAGFMMDPAGNVEDGSWLNIQVGSVTPPPPPPVDKVFSKTYAPTQSGTDKVGRTKTAHVKTWSPKASIHYQWTRGGTAIVGATKSKYTLTADDLGSAITVTVTGTRPGYTATVKTSNPSKVVAPGTITKGKVGVSGSRKVGRTLTASTPRWTSGVTFGYSWQKLVGKVWLPIVGATGKSYVLTPADKGARIRVIVTATKLGYIDATPKTSARTGKVGLGDLSKVTPTITGTTIIVDETLTAITGAWKPPETTFGYQWYRDGKKIAGATAATYLLVKKDIGKHIKVKVTGRAIGYHTSSRYAKSTAKVAALTPPPTPTPTPTASPSPTPTPTPTSTP